MLTLEHASAGPALLGYVLNHLESQLSLAAETNLQAPRYLTSVPCLGEIPYLEGLETKRSFLPSLFEEKFNLRLLETILPRK